MARLYITEGLIRYSVVTTKLETESNYDTSIQIKMVGKRFPIWGTVMKSNDNVRKFAKEIIKQWAKPSKVTNIA